MGPSGGLQETSNKPTDSAYKIRLPELLLTFYSQFWRTGYFLIFQHSLSLSMALVQAYELGPHASRRFEDYNEVTGEDISERKNGGTYCSLKSCMIRIYTYT